MQLTAVQRASESLQRMCNAMAIDAARHRRCSPCEQLCACVHKHQLFAASYSSCGSHHMRLTGDTLCRSHQNDSRVPFTVGPVQEDPAR